MAGRKSDFAVPPRTKIRVVARVEKILFEEIKRIHEEEVAMCKREDRNEPEWSSMLKMLLRKGVLSYRTNLQPAKKRALALYSLWCCRASARDG